METERALLLRLALLSQLKIMLTVWVPAKRSARFYGEYVGQDDHAYQESQEETPELSHIASPPFAGKWLTAIYVTAPLSGPALGHIHHSMLCRRLSIFAVTLTGAVFCL